MTTHFQDQAARRNHVVNGHWQTPAVDGQIIHLKLWTCLWIARIVRVELKVYF